MKKTTVLSTILLAFLLAAPILTSAQVKKVAILKTVDAEGNVPYGIKLQLRSSLIYAISHTTGYEAIERVDVPSIMDEQQFQRSGLVSDSEVKEIGRMNGADYVLVAEAALYDESNILVMAKLLDVVTGTIKESADPQIAPKKPDELREACIQIARTLLGKIETKKIPQGYTDLGLSSGTLWKDKNVTGFYSYDDAIGQIGGRLPTKAQWNELKTECQWDWIGEGYKITGPNGSSIILPALGYKSCNGSVRSAGTSGWYWSSTLLGADEYWGISFDQNEVGLYGSDKCFGKSIRMCETPFGSNEKKGYSSTKKSDYTDLGLPSGTKWKNSNATGLYTYDEAIKTFGNKLPTKKQWEELINECKWTWTGGTMKITGPNGNSITMPAEGMRHCKGQLMYEGSVGGYLSSTPNGAENTWSILIAYDGVGFYELLKCNGHSIRLVEN